MQLTALNSLSGSLVPCTRPPSCTKPRQLTMNYVTRPVSLIKLVSPLDSVKPLKPNSIENKSNAITTQGVVS